jgi:putative transposase
VGRLYSTIMTMTNLPEKYKGIYRIPSNRLKGWDYSAPGYYFVTICTHKKIPWFGEVNHDRVTLSPTGEIVAQNIERIPAIYSHIQLDVSVFMPNHIHAIIVIVETPQWGVSTAHAKKTMTLGIIVNQFKTSCTKQIHTLGFTDFAWQPRYYDHIIRNEQSLQKIRAYILGNPAQWSNDEYFHRHDL